MSALTPDGRYLAAAVFRQHAAYIFDLAEDQHVAKVNHRQVYGLSFSPDGETLATAGWDQAVRFWATESGESRRELMMEEEENQNRGDLRMYTVRYAPRGGLLATAHLDGVVRI